MESMFYRHRLPHIRVDGAVYFVTWRVGLGQAELSKAERDCVADALYHFQDVRYRLHAYVVMDDHVHDLVEPLAGNRLEAIIRSWKSFTANRMQREFGRIGAVWQDEYFDRAVRDDIEYDQKRNYILNNPFKRWPEIEAYRWSWAVGIDRPPSP